MKLFNTLLFVQSAPAGIQGSETQVVEQQNQASETQTHTTEPVSSPEGNLPKEGSKAWTNYVFILLLIVVFYLFFIRPQSKRAKDERKFRESLKKGDKIITTAGIYGKVLEIEDTTVIIETEGQGKLKMDKSAIVKTVNPEK